MNSKLHAGWVRFRALLRKLNPPQVLALGFLSYVAIGWLVLTTPFAQHNQVGALDNLFIATSAMSTTGLVTVSVGDDYSLFGQLVVLLLFQIGALGYMTFSSFVILARKSKLPPGREKLLVQQFSLPKDFRIRTFLKQVVVFTLMLETLGAAALYEQFRVAGLEDPAWHAIFHSVSAFCTAGFSLNNDSLEAFRGNLTVNLVIGVLSYSGAIGFIVLVDAWRRLTRRGYRMTFTSRIILIITGLTFAVLTPTFALFDPYISVLPFEERWLTAAFQVMTASTTAGFNTIPIGKLGAATLVLFTVVMVVGASPSGTGGGMKTTTVSALFAMARSTLRGEPRPSLYGQEIPVERMHTAVTNLVLYTMTLTWGVLAIAVTQGEVTQDLIFECASALGTVGLSMGSTGELTEASKLVVIALMFLGRLGPLTAGFAFVRRRTKVLLVEEADLSV